MIKKKKVVERRNHQGKDAFMIAAEMNHTEIAKYIIESFPDIDLTKVDIKGGNTALHYCVMNNNIEVVK